jgi:hypothetical protein
MPTKKQRLAAIEQRMAKIDLLMGGHDIKLSEKRIKDKFNTLEANIIELRSHFDGTPTTMLQLERSLEGHHKKLKGMDAAQTLDRMTMASLENRLDHLEVKMADSITHCQQVETNHNASIRGMEILLAKLKDNDVQHATKISALVQEKNNDMVAINKNFKALETSLNKLIEDKNLSTKKKPAKSQRKG